MSNWQAECVALRRFVAAFSWACSLGNSAGAGVSLYLVPSALLSQIMNTHAMVAKLVRSGIKMKKIWGSEKVVHLK